MKKIRIGFCILLMIAFLPSCLTGCGTKKMTQPYTASGFYFDTFVTFTIYEDPAGQEHAEQVVRELKSACERYERVFSATIDGSDISRINAAQGEPVKVQPETLDILERSLYYAELTDGAFDPTMKVISDLWNIRAETPRIPDEASIQEALAHVGYRSIIITGDMVSLADPDSKIDLGGIAKGYIADQLKSYLIAQEIPSAVISLGGNIAVLGAKPDRTDFVIGLQKPFAQQGETIAVVQVTDKTVVTSGNYERFFEQDGVIYHHIMDPQTGAPVQNDLYAVTIIADSSTEADALSTACYVLGEEKAVELLKKLENTEAFFIDYNLQIGVTDNDIKLQKTP